MKKYKYKKPVTILPLPCYLLLLVYKKHLRIYDCRPLLNKGVFKALKEPNVFNSVCMNSIGSPTWCNDTIDIAPEEVYKHSIQVR